MPNTHLDPMVQSFVEELSKNDGKPLYELTPRQAREVLINVQKDKPEVPAADTVETTVPLAGGKTMRVLIVRPLQNTEPLPVIFYIHGGGWVMGNEETHKRLIYELSTQVNAAVIFPIYESSPESQYPKTTENLFTTLQYMAAHGAEYNLDTSRLAVAGDSAGGNMATVMALMAKAAGNQPEILFQLLLYPVTNAGFETDSYHQFTNGPWLTKKAMEWFWDQYATDKEKRKEIYASPLLASKAELANLPPALIITGENDVLRDEGEAYARKLNDAGVKTAGVRINGTIHDFLMLNALADTPPSQTGLMIAVSALKKALA